MKNRNLNHKDDWATPTSFYTELNKEFGFTFDPCPFMHDIHESGWSGLEIEWGEINYVNPPYSDDKSTGYLKSSFIRKAIREAKKGRISVVLIPVSTSTKLFHDLILPNASEIRFIKRRLKFRGRNDKGQYVNWDNPNKSETIDYITESAIDGSSEIIIQIPKYVSNSGMHDSMLVIFDNKNIKDEIVIKREY